MMNVAEEKRNKKRVSKSLVILSMIIGLAIQIMFYYMFSINIKYVSPFAVVLLWIANSVVSGCVLDEVFSRLQ